MSNIQPILQVLAMSRSGHHAMIEHFIHQVGGSFIHWNYFRNGKPTQIFKYNNGILQGEYYDEISSDSFITVNVENQKPSQPLPFNSPTVLFIRDAYNNFASRLKANKGSLEDIDIWIAQAKEAIGDTNYISRKRVLLYNEWRDNANWHKESVAYNRGSSFGSIQGTVKAPGDEKESGTINVYLFQPGACPWKEGKAFKKRSFNEGLMAIIHVRRGEFSQDQLPAGTFDVVAVRHKEETVLKLDIKQVTLAEGESKTVDLDVFDE